jgi:hypothetical protein
MLNTVPLKNIQNTSNNKIHEEDEKIIKSLIQNKIADKEYYKENAFREIDSISSQHNYAKIVIDHPPKGNEISAKCQNDKIIFYNNNNEIGFFTPEYVFKYLGNIYDTKKQFLNLINQEEYSKSKEIIKTYFFNLKYNKETGFVHIDLHNYSSSELMGNLELLMRIIKNLLEYKNMFLQNNLNNIDAINKEKISQNINKFICILLNYTLELIMKSDKNNNNTIKYSAWLIMNINSIIKNEISITTYKNTEFDHLISTNTNIKNIIIEKLNEITKQIEIQTKILKNNSINKEEIKNTIKSNLQNMKNYLDPIKDINNVDKQLSKEHQYITQHNDFLNQIPDNSINNFTKILNNSK